MPRVSREMRAGDKSAAAQGPAPPRVPLPGVGGGALMHEVCLPGCIACLAAEATERPGVGIAATTAGLTCLPLSTGENMPFCPDGAAIEPGG